MCPGGDEYLDHTRCDLLDHRRETSVAIRFAGDGPFIQGRFLEGIGLGFLAERDGRTGHGQHAAQRQGGEAVEQRNTFHKSLILVISLLVTVMFV